MSTKRKASTADPKKDDPKALTVDQLPTEGRAEALAHTALRPTIQAALTLMDLNKGFGELSINTLVDDLVHQCESANGGDLKRAVSMLTAQAHTLDAMFHNLARRSALNMGDYINAAETYARLALKAQSQCRATLETLATIKNPQPIAFVRQANIANGPQQVNNGAEPSLARAENSGSQQSKLLEQQNGEWLDTGTAGAASGGDKGLEAVGAIHRAENRGR